MALHGDISINGHRIATWSARRLYELMDDGEHDYEVKVTWDSADGRAASGAGFWITHAYRDGATALAAKVLAEAATYAPPAPQITKETR